MALVLLHAFPLHSGLWDHVRSLLDLPAGEVLVPDFRGFGQTSLTDTGSNIVPSPSLEVLARDVLNAMDEAGFERPIIAGVSLGGYVAMAMLRVAPERVGGLVLIDTKAGADAEPARANRIRIATEMEQGGDVRVLARAMLPGLLGESTHADQPAIVERIRAMIESADPAAIAWVQRAMANRPDSHDVLTSYVGPVAIVWGEEDALAGWADQESMLAAFADRGDGRFAAPGTARGPATFHRVAKAGHLTPVEAPAEVAAVLSTR